MSTTLLSMAYTLTNITLYRILECSRLRKPVLFRFQAATAVCLLDASSLALISQDSLLVSLVGYLCVKEQYESWLPRQCCVKVALFTHLVTLTLLANAPK